MARRVKGSLFVDYVRMLRSDKTADWSRYLTPEDLSFLVQRIEPADWYPIETFERMGLAILAEIAKGDFERVRAWGRSQTEGLTQLHGQLIQTQDPRDSLMQFEVIRNSFFDWQAVRLTHVSDGEAAIEVLYEMSALAEQAASIQVMGFFERLLELTGAKDVKAWFSAEHWKGAPVTTILLTWTP